jgi:hypothetical protein
MLKKIIFSSVALSLGLFASSPSIASVTPSATTVAPGTAVTLTAVLDNGGETTSRIWSVSNGSTKGSGTWSKDTLNSVKWTPSAGGTYTVTLVAKNSSGSANKTAAITVTQSVPNGFIKIPGSENYSFAGQTPANGWAVMKWEAGYYSATPTSQSTTTNYYTTPYYSDYSPGNYGAQAISSMANRASISDISRNEAEALCSNSTYLKDSSGGALSNGHLLPVGLWKKIADDVSQQAINWSGNAVGSGNISRGLANNNSSKGSGYADFSYADNYNSQTTVSNPAASNYYDKRVWKLSNGDVIHDFAGNLWEWYYDLHSSTTNPSYSGWVEYSSGNYTVVGYSIDPAYNTNWTSTQGIGKLLPYMIYSGTEYAAIFGGNWSDAGSAGVFASNWYSYSPSTLRVNNFGFRCVVPLP